MEAANEVVKRGRGRPVSLRVTEGDVFGKWQVLESAEKGYTRVPCRCLGCGRGFGVVLVNLTEGTSTQCVFCAHDRLRTKVKEKAPASPAERSLTARQQEVLSLQHLQQCEIADKLGVSRQRIEQVERRLGIRRHKERRLRAPLFKVGYKTEFKEIVSRDYGSHAGELRCLKCNRVEKRRLHASSFKRFCRICSPDWPTALKFQVKAGAQYGYWTVLADGRTAKGQVPCRCGNCGKEKEVTIRYLVEGKSRSCIQCSAVLWRLRKAEALKAAA